MTKRLKARLRIVIRDYEKLRERTAKSIGNYLKKRSMGKSKLESRQ